MTRKPDRHRIASAIAALALLAGCQAYPDKPEHVGGYVRLKTYGDIATAATRARLECGDPYRVPGLMTLEGEGPDQTATFNCM